MRIRLHWRFYSIRCSNASYLTNCFQNLLQHKCKRPGGSRLCDRRDRRLEGQVTAGVFLPGACFLVPSRSRRNGKEEEGKGRGEERRGEERRGEERRGEERRGEGRGGEGRGGEERRGEERRGEERRGVYPRIQVELIPSGANGIMHQFPISASFPFAVSAMIPMPPALSLSQRPLPSPTLSWYTN